MTEAEIGSKIIDVASRFLGLYEVKANADWKTNNAKMGNAIDILRRGLIQAGWRAGWPYCAAWVEMVWRLAYTEANAPGSLIKTIAANLCPSVMQSFDNVIEWRGAISQRPVFGAIVFWQKGNTRYGHAGIVTIPSKSEFETIEANTSQDPNASDEAKRDGEGIFRKHRRIDFSHSDGLHLLGFLSPPTW